MTETTERILPRPEIGDDYRTFWRGLLNQDIREKTNILLDREGVGADEKEFKFEMGVPSQLMHLLRLRSKRDSYNGIIADLLTITKDCQNKFVISHLPASNEEGKSQPASLRYEFTSEVKGKVVGNYALTLREGEPPRAVIKAKKGLRYKKIPKWVTRIEKAGDRDFEIIRDTIDFIVAEDAIQTLQRKEYIEHQRQIKGGRYIDDYSQEAREIGAKARARVLKDWPGANVDELD